MKKTILLTLALLLGVSHGAWAQNLTIISTQAEWDEFADAVSGGTTYSGQTVKLVADLTITKAAGSSDTNSFQGTFDGGGHTLTLNLSHTGGGDAFIGPFRYIKSATIKRLHTAGTITTNGKMAGGIVADSWGTSTIQNCRSSVTISSTVSGDGTHGGLVARVQNGKLTITDCLFDGSITGTSTHSCGGFVGWKKASLVLNHCLLAGNFTGIGSDNGSTFCRYNSGDVDFSTCYYKAAYGSVQGTSIGSMSNADLAAALGPVWEVGESGVVPIIDVMNLALATVSGVASEYQCTGNEIKPEPEVTSADGTVLEKDTHYTVTWSGNGTATGKYTLTITGKSPYCGTQTATYTVVEPLMDYSDYTFSTDTDSLGDFFVIDSKDALRALSYKVNNAGKTYNGKRFKQTADIDMSYVTWTPIVNDVSSGYRSFKGTYDGDGYFITNIDHRMEGNNTLSGLFGCLDGTVKNVNLKDCNFGAKTAGGIAGETSYGTIRNCNVLGGTISSTLQNAYGGYLGGISGELYGGTINGCFTTASFARSERSIARGPVAGQGDVKGTITDSYYVNSPGGNSEGTQVTVYGITLGDGITMSGNFRTVGRTAENTYHFGKAGDVVTLSATSPIGYAANYSVNGNPLEGNSFTMPAEDVVVSVSFTKIPGAFQATLTEGRKDNLTAWWGTFYDSSTNYTLSEDAAAYTMGSDYHLYRLGTDGRAIPAGKAVVIISLSANVTFTPAGTIPAITDHAAGGNILQGNSTEAPVSVTTYVLGREGNTIGFYQYNGNAIPAGIAYYTVNQ